MSTTERVRVLAGGSGSSDLGADFDIPAEALSLLAARTFLSEMFKDEVCEFSTTLRSVFLAVEES